jgi:hypothetical protein
MNQASNDKIELPEEIIWWWKSTAIPMANLRGHSVDYWSFELFTEETTKVEIEQDIKDYWDVTNADSCKSTVRSLIGGEYTGHIWQHRFRKRSCSTSHQWKSIIDSTPTPIDAAELRFIETTYLQAGVSGFLAWDLTRAAYLIRQGYFLGWVSRHELFFILNFIALRSQESFSSWRQFTNSIVYGRNVGNYLHEESTIERVETLNSEGYALTYRNYFHYLEDDHRNGVYDTPWETPLPIMEVPESLRAQEEQEEQ